MTIRPGCTLRPPERPNILGNQDNLPLPQSGPVPATASTSPPEVLPVAKRPVTPEDVPYFRRKLHEHLTVARSRIREALLRTDAEHYADIAGQVHDAQDESLADLLVDVSLDEIDREVLTVRDIDAAQRRIRAGTYGLCLDCGDRIDFGRLDAYPSAKRCLSCQVRHEQGATPTPRL